MKVYTCKVSRWKLFYYCTITDDIECSKTSKPKSLLLWINTFSLILYIQLLQNIKVILNIYEVLEWQLFYYFNITDNIE